MLPSPSTFSKPQTVLKTAGLPLTYVREGPLKFGPGAIRFQSRAIRSLVPFRPTNLLPTK